MRAKGPGIAKAISGHEDLELDAWPELVALVLQDVDTLVARDAQTELSAFAWGDSTEGAADLIRSIAGVEPEALRVSWIHNEIQRIEIEPRPSLSFARPNPTAVVAEVVDTLAPMVWRHIRRGGELPAGVERFAVFFSIRSATPRG